MILDKLIGAVPVPRVAHEALISRQEAADRGALVGRPGRRDADERDEPDEPDERDDDDPFARREGVSA